MDINQILTEYDAYYARNDAEGAYAFITAQMAEARECGRWQDELTMLNEVIGYSRKHLMKAEGHEYIDRAETIINEHGLSGEVAAATTWLNAATALRAFGEPEDSLRFFRMTEAVYGQKMEPFDYRYASLYNNMSLVFSDTGDYERAEELAGRAAEILITDPDSGAELAATYVTLAVICAKKGAPAADVRGYVDRAMALLDPEGELPDQYYAYMCRVNAGSLAQLGFERESARLIERARDYYEKIGR